MNDTTRAASLGRLASRRIIWLVPILVAVSAAIFLLQRVSPGDPIGGVLGGFEEFASSDAVTAVQRETTGGAWLADWWQWVTGIFHGTLGDSLVYRMPVVDVISARAPWTILLVAGGLMGALVVGLALAVLATIKPNGVLDRIISSAIWAFSATPGFVIGLLLISLVSMKLRLLPAGGLTSAGEPATFFTVAQHAILPITAQIIANLPWVTLHLRASVVDAWQSPAVNAARLNGITEPRILASTVLPTSWTSVLAITGARLPEIIAGAVVLEGIFSWPGMGQALVDAALAQDTALIAATTLLLTVLSVAGALCTDTLLALLDPRVKADEL